MFAGSPSIVQRSAGSSGIATSSGRCEVAGRYASSTKWAPSTGDVIATGRVVASRSHCGGAGSPAAAAHARSSGGSTTAVTPHTSWCQSQVASGTWPVMNSSRLLCSQCGPGSLPDTGHTSASTMVSGRGGSVGLPKRAAIAVYAARTSGVAPSVDITR